MTWYNINLNENNKLNKCVQLIKCVKRIERKKTTKNRRQTWILKDTNISFVVVVYCWVCKCVFRFILFFKIWGAFQWYNFSVVRILLASLPHFDVLEWQLRRQPIRTVTNNTRKKKIQTKKANHWKLFELKIVNLLHQHDISYASLN